MMGVKDGCFFIWQIALYGNALSCSCTKLRNRDFVSMFAGKNRRQHSVILLINDRAKPLLCHA